MRQQFGLTFDLRNSKRPDTEGEAIGYTRKWASFVGVELPDELEPKIYQHDAEAGEPGSFPSLTVSFEWDDGT